MNVKIVALDPGKTTGWAIAEWDGESTSAEMVACGECHGIEQLGRWLDSNLYVPVDWPLPEQEPCRLIVIYEGFKLYAHKAQALVMDDMVAPRAIGVIQYVCARHAIEPVMQMASAAKQITNTYLMEYLEGAYEIARSSHMMDACRHVVYYVLYQHNQRKQQGQHPSGCGCCDCENR